jgi:chaperonin GroES
MAKTIKPLYDRVVVRRLESEQTTAGGIIIPDTAQEKTQMGTIVAAGAGRVAKDGSIRPLQVKEGDTILFGKFSGTEVKFEGEDLLILKEEELLGLVQG